nr:uncharacterized protein LOC129017662 [Pongo pygmaeus]
MPPVTHIHTICCGIRQPPRVVTRSPPRIRPCSCLHVSCKARSAFWSPRAFRSGAGHCSFEGGGRQRADGSVKFQLTLRLETYGITVCCSEALPASPDVKPVPEARQSRSPPWQCLGGGALRLRPDISTGSTGTSPDARSRKGPTRMRKPQAESGGSSTPSQPQTCPDAFGSAVNRRHFSAPQKLHADCEKEMLDGGVPETTVRVSFDFSCLEMVRELWMWNVE